MAIFDETATYSSAELADLSGVAQSTVSYYVRKGVIPAVPFRGPLTRYTANHLLALLVIRRLNVRKHGLPALKRLLRESSREKLLALAGFDLPPPKEAVTGPYRGRRQHVCHVVNLAPGVDLHVSAGADAEAQRVANEIVERYGR